MTDWHHSPVHRLGDANCFMVTAGTYLRQHFFRSPARLSYLQDSLLKLASEYGWRLQAWVIFSNHYHIIVMGTPESKPLDEFIQRLHTITALEVNTADQTPLRKVWFQY